MMEGDAVEKVQAMTAGELREIWRGASQDASLREEALWAYWQRVAEGHLPFVKEELQVALTLESTRVADVLGVLAQRDRLPDDVLAAVRRGPAPLAAHGWLQAQLAARAMLRRLAAGDEPATVELCDALVAKGTAWAAIEAVPRLNRAQREALVAAAEERRCFTRGQRHDLRTGVAASR